MGDWTTLDYKDPNQEDINISPVINVNFDSLPKNIVNEAHLLHYRLAEKVIKKLVQDLNMKVELHMVSATQVSYEDFLNTQVEKLVQSDFNISDLGSISMIFDWGLADMLVNRMTGGRGEESHSDIFSDIETELLDIELQNIIP